MPYDRKHFFDTVRKDLFRGNLRQSQVDGMNYLLEQWEQYFEQPNPRDGTNWLTYALATFFHETAETMQPIEEYGKGSGRSYGQPVGPYNQRYYGRGHVQLTWETNYKNAEKFLFERYNERHALHKEPHLMLKDHISALVSYDGMIHGWFTGVGLPKYFNATTNDPRNARRIVNGTDRMDLIAGYHAKFLKALKKTETIASRASIEMDLPGLPDAPPMPEPLSE